VFLAVTGCGGDLSANLGTHDRGETLFPNGSEAPCAGAAVNGLCAEIGTFYYDTSAQAFSVRTFVPTANNMVHAEGHIMAATAADFTYTADLLVTNGGEANLQFRLTDEGRYGIALANGQLRLYEQLRNPDTGSPLQANYTTTDLQLVNSSSIVENAWIHVSVSALGDTLQCMVSRGGKQVASLSATTSNRPKQLRAGRFGIYGKSPSTSTGLIEFGYLTATADATRGANFALLYAPAGYDLDGPKRVMVRTLTPLTSTAVDLVQSRYSVRNSAGTTIASGALQQGPVTFGIQTWEADFTGAISAAGSYNVEIDLYFLNGSPPVVLSTQSFPVQPRIFSNSVLPFLTLANAEARRAADEDSRRGSWSTAGTWTALADGSFEADNADANGGATMQRVLGMGYQPLASTANYSADDIVVGQITMVGGCDAQLQFRIGSNRYGVTIQAGGAGGCPYYSGPAMLRLHEEGAYVPNGFNVLTTQSIQNFALYHPYNVLAHFVTENGVRYVRVQLDGVETLRAPINGYMEHDGQVAVKVWGGSARFSRLQMWNPSLTVAFRNPTLSPVLGTTESTGEYYAFYQWTGWPCDGTIQSGNTAQYWGSASSICNPVFAQRHGFHDCNNYIGEATSHGAFLAGLLETWTDRAASWNSTDRARLQNAILTDVGYLKLLFDQAGRTGEYAHEEYGRGGVLTNLGSYQTLDALYGDAAFAELGAGIDWNGARLACIRTWYAAHWLNSHGAALTSDQQALIYHQIATCATRHNLSFPGDQSLRGTSAELDADAISAGASYIANFENSFAGTPRDPGRVIPWFEGIYKLKLAFPNNSTVASWNLTTIAQLMHDRLISGSSFHVIPFAADADPSKNQSLWNDMSGVPVTNSDLTRLQSGRLFYGGAGFGTGASDMALLGRMAPGVDLKPIAAAQTQWTFGVNPGVPYTKLTGSLAGGSAWGAASFVHNGGAPAARGFEGVNAAGSRAKSWTWPWETVDHIESWWVNPTNNGFMSIVNGHMLWEGDWDYANLGENGWLSGETFLLTDGAVTKGALAYEDYVEKPCAGGATATDWYSTRMAGCAAAVSWSSRASLCGPQYHVCSASDWAALFPTPAPAPKHNYWTNDNLLYGGNGSGSCSVSTSSGNSCGTNQPMRVCTPSGTDAEGNHCNWSNCDWGSVNGSVDYYFGGCVGNTTAGALCCRN
jgi:hypothetical protein